MTLNNDFQDIAYNAEECFKPFVDKLIEHSPDLVLKYGINYDMKTEYVEGILVQYWSNEALNEKDLLEYMSKTYKSNINKL